MSTQTLYTLSPVLQSVGTLGPFVPASALKVSPQGWQIALTNGSDWPTTGGSVCTILIEVAPQMSNFGHDYSITLSSGGWTVSGPGSAATNSGSIFINGGWNDGMLTRTARLTVTMLRACTLGFVWTAL